MKARKAFTLIELLVVVAIIALLIAILLPSLGRAREQAKLVKCGTNLKAIGTSIYSYASGNADIVVQSHPFYRDDVAAVPPAGPGKACGLCSFPELLWLDGDLAQLQNPYLTGSGHYPIGQQVRSIFQCPSQSPDVQYGMGIVPYGNYGSASYGGYGLNYYQRSFFQASPAGFSNCGTIGDKGALPSQYVKDWDGTPSQPIIRRLSSLKPSKILAFEGYYDAGTGGNGNGSYWIYNRHMATVTTKNVSIDKYKGLSNYLFVDGHVEANGEYNKMYPAAPIYASLNGDAKLDASPFGGPPPNER